MRRDPEQAVVDWLDGQPSESIWTTAVTVFEVRTGLHLLGVRQATSRSPACVRRAARRRTRGPYPVLRHRRGERGRRDRRPTTVGRPAGRDPRRPDRRDHQGATRSAGDPQHAPLHRSRDPTHRPVVRLTAARAEPPPTIRRWVSSVQPRRYSTTTIRVRPTGAPPRLAESCTCRRRRPASRVRAARATRGHARRPQPRWACPSALAGPPRAGG